jgi:hypothetical protein
VQNLAPNSTDARQVLSSLQLDDDHCIVALNPAQSDAILGALGYMPENRPAMLQFIEDALENGSRVVRMRRDDLLKRERQRLQSMVFDRPYADVSSRI